MTTTRVAFAALVACALAACGSGKPKEQVAVIDVAAVNALVPPALRDAVVFEQRQIASIMGAHDPHYTLAAPRGWAIPSTKWARFKSDEGSALELHVGAEGGFHAQDWAKVSERDFPPVEAGERVVKDERAAGHRTRIVATDERVRITTAWWIDGADRYHTCIARLAGALVDAAPAFERACAAVGVVEE
jgi:hypothetical protein